VSSTSDRLITLGEGLPPVPERLLLAQAQGSVLFIVGAGVSQPAGLPDFRQLVLDVYEELDFAVHAVIADIPRSACNQWVPKLSALTPTQKAEVRRFITGDYDVVLGMLERRIDGAPTGRSRVRDTVSSQLRRAARPAPLHRALMRLADRGNAVTIVTTNFDLLLEAAAYRTSPRIRSHSLGGIPRPGHRDDFAGVLHIHGSLDPDPSRTSDLTISDRDFGEFYLRRRLVADFIYDAARLFNLVLVGYSANDPPMRYLLNAVAADGSRFSDLKERFTFVGSEAYDAVSFEDWRGRGISPIHYDSGDGHVALRKLMQRWADVAPRKGRPTLVDAMIKRIVQKKRSKSSDEQRDLFDHFVRRADSNERVRISTLAANANADLGWLDAMVEVAKEG